VKIEMIFWILVPIIFGAFLLFKTTSISIRRKGFLNWVLTIAIWIAVIFSAIMFGNMYLYAAWPSFLPHILIGISLLLLLLQTSLKNLN